MRDKRPGVGLLVWPAREAAITREYDGLRTRAHTQLVENAGEVIAHGLLADEQLRCDVEIAVAASNQVEDLALTRRERGEIITCGRSIGGAAPRGRALPAQEFADDF